MCTLLFIPEKNNCFFASLRDENPQRAVAKLPTLIEENGTRYIAPIDPSGSGTWLGVNHYGNVVVLLNGGFVKHQRQAVYAKSRGLIVTEMLRAKAPMEVWARLCLEGVEPFTVVTWNGAHLLQLTWDGSTKHRISLDHKKSHIWSSATLYTPTAQATRKQLFDTWIANKPHITPQTVLDFFGENEDKQDGFLMNRQEIVKTLSYTFIQITDLRRANLQYYDWQNNAETPFSIELSLNR